MFKIAMLIWLFCFSFCSAEEVPAFLSPKADLEYRETINYFKEILPQKEASFAYLALLAPYGLLDIHPTKFTQSKNKQGFANFNLGVIASGIAEVPRDLVTKLPNLALCHKVECREARIDMLKEFLGEIKPHLATLKRSNELELVQQLSNLVYRINNAFITPTDIVVYHASKEAGFIPSASYSRYRHLDELPEIHRFSQETRKIRAIMNSYGVNAIAKIDGGGFNVVVSGLSDNHWGVVLHDGDVLAKVGDINPLGYKYDDIVRIAPDAFYYQTN